MPNFLSISGSLSKFSKSGYLLRTLGSLLEQRSIEFEAVHGVDTPEKDLAGGRLVKQFVEDTVSQIEIASAILLIVPFSRANKLGTLEALLGFLPDNVFSGKALLLFVTGGQPGEIPLVERALQPALLRLGALFIAARVQLQTNDWIIVGDDPPYLSRAALREIAGTLDFVIRGISIRPSAQNSATLESAGSGSQDRRSAGKRTKNRLITARQLSAVPV
jgi:NAD(P)H-dependent FMN reductase